MGSDVNEMSSGASTAPTDHRRDGHRVDNSHDAAERVARDDTSERRLGDDLARDEAGAADQRRRQRDRERSVAAYTSCVAQNTAPVTTTMRTPSCSPRADR